MTDIADITGIEQAEGQESMEDLAEEVKAEPQAEPAKPKRQRRTKAKVEHDALEEANELERLQYGATIAQVAALNCETPEDEIGYRPADFKNPQGKQLAYVDARYVMDVLDREVGPSNWESTYMKHDDGSVECTIMVTMRGGGYVRKCDVGTPSTIEAVKGAYSDAFKRAAVHFGIARDLYDERMAEGPSAPKPAAAPVAAAPAAAPATITEATAAPAAEAPAAEPTVESWVCPIHGTGRIQPAGVSKRTGKAYSAFWVCDTPGCRQTGGNA